MHILLTKISAAPERDDTMQHNSLTTHGVITAKEATKAFIISGNLILEKRDRPRCVRRT